ncbi:MAG TPA: immunoglobulin domain-containing protein, partial [Candidatus Acidoferrum sp.]|nr:immunoglobulin domain-containing protein [Candidatus Acidoferrum sp.]
LIYQWTFGGTNIAGATNASLALNNIQPAQSGNYAVWVANDYGSALSSNAVLAVGYPPTIITDLTNEEVLVGGTAIFSVTAIGLLPLHYQWSFGSGYAPGDTNTLTVTNVQYAQTGSQVLVYITNPLGFTFSSNVVLTVALPPSITAQPVDQTVPVGSPVSFGVTVQGTEPLSYQWRLNGTKVAGATNGTLTIPSAQPTNAGIYSVVVTNRYGSVTSSNAQLTVSGTGGGCANPPFGLVSWWPAEGNANDIIGGNNGTLLNGVTFTNGEVGLAFAFQGGDDGVPRSAVQIPYSPTLTTAHFSVETWINPVSQVNNGDNRSLIFGESYGFVQLIVQQGVNGVVPAMLIANSSGAVASTNEIPIGQFTHVVATWNGTALRLYLNGAFNNQSVPGGQPSPSGCPFYIGGFNHPDAGCQTLSQYFNGLIDEVSYYSRALADSEIKALYQAGSLGKCSSIPPVVASQPASQTVYAGGATSFTVAAGGSTPLSLQWVCNGTNVTGATNSSLSLTNVQFSQAGTYNVGITNAYGSVVSSNASLTVLALAILTQPADQAAVVGQPASFSVIADSVAPLHYQWRANGTNIIGSTNATLNLAKAQFSQAGNYAVLITNIYGSLLSSNAVLRVNNPGTVPVCDLVDLQAAVAVGGPITFGCDGVITLTSTLNITKPTSLDAAGHHVTISGGNAVRLFYVAPGVAFSVTNLLLANGLCLGNNGTAGTPADGGAIYNDGGAVTLVGCTVTNNSAQSLVPGGLARGGAIFNNAGTVSLYQTSLSNNATIGQGYNDSVTWINGIGLGGAIYNTNGSMAITGCNVSSNFCYGACTYRGTGLAMGGAAFQASGFLTVTNSVFAFNQVLGGNGANNPGGSGSPAYGGALAANGGSITIQHSQFLTNTATGGDAGYHGAGGPVFGGAVYSTAILSAADSSFSGNQALAGNWQIVPTSGTRGADGCGGAIYNSGLAVLSRCSVCSNLVNGGTGYNAFGLSAADGGNGLGGGIFNDSQLLATNCTAALNSAVGGMGHGPGVTGTALGGGVFNNTNAVFVALNLTLASNSCSSPALSIPFNSGQGTAAGSQVANTNGTLRLQNSILAYSTNSDAYGTILDNGYNLCSDNSAGLYAAGSHNNTNPLLGPLGDYGGPTLTMPLLVGSPAIDGGSTAAAPPVDQRGHARPYGAAADIGAFESSPPYFIGGQVAGPAGFVATVTIGSSNLFLSTPGSYGLEGFAAGSYTVTPSNSTFLFVPASSLVTVGPDQLAVNFNAYRSNYLSMEAVTNGMVPLFFAAPTGQTYRTLTSSNLLLWVPIATNTLGPTAYFRIFVPMTTEPGRFYRTVSP